MKATLALALSAALLFAGCATQPKQNLAAARAAGVSPAIMHKLEHWGSLSPSDLIELKRRHVNDAIALRQIKLAGVDYVVDKSILKKLRKAGVSETVMFTLFVASRRFVGPYPPTHYWVGSWYHPWGPYYPYDPLYYDLGWPYPRAYFAPGPVGPGPIGPGPGLGGPRPGPGGFGGGIRGPRP